MTPGLARLRHWAKIVKHVLVRWQALLSRRRSGRLGRVVGAPRPLDTESSAHNDNALPAVGADGVVAGLVRALSDPSVEVAVAAIQALSTRNEPRIDSALLEVATSTDGYFSPVTRARAIDALAKRLAPSELGPIFDAVRDVDADVSVAAIAAIGENAPHAAGSVLLPLLRDCSGYYLPLVRLAATQALEHAGALTQDVAGQLLEDEGDADVRRVLEDAFARTPGAKLELGHSG